MGRASFFNPLHEVMEELSAQHPERVLTFNTCQCPCLTKRGKALLHSLEQACSHQNMITAFIVFIFIVSFYLWPIIHLPYGKGIVAVVHNSLLKQGNSVKSKKSWGKEAA